MNRRPAARHLLLVLAWALCASAALARDDAPAPARELHGRVVGVADGDTLTLLADERAHKIRLAQIDAPEKSQPYGKAAKRALSELVFGRDVRVEVVDVDRYDRIVGEVFVDGLHVNLEMVRRGHAWAYTRYARTPEVAELENAARAEGLGLWRLPLEEREAPWVWRRQRRSAGSSSTKAKESPPPASGPHECGTRRLCREMRSCEEARFHLEQCGLTRLDGDGDGIPCEKLCRSGWR